MNKAFRKEWKKGTLENIRGAGVAYKISSEELCVKMESSVEKALSGVSSDSMLSWGMVKLSNWYDRHLFPSVDTTKGVFPLVPLLDNVSAVVTVLIWWSRLFETPRNLTFPVKSWLEFNVFLKADNLLLHTTAEHSSDRCFNVQQLCVHPSVWSQRKCCEQHSQPVSVTPPQNAWKMKKSKIISWPKGVDRWVPKQKRTGVRDSLLRNKIDVFILCILLGISSLFVTSVSDNLSATVRCFWCKSQVIIFFFVGLNPGIWIATYISHSWHIQCF